MKKNRFAFLLGQNGGKGKAILTCFSFVLAFMLLSSAAAAQKVFKEDIPIEKLELQIEHISSNLSQIPASQANSEKVLYYQGYLAFLQAVHGDMQSGDTYSVAVMKNHALMPQHPNQSAQSLRNGAAPATQQGAASSAGQKSQYSKKRDN